MKKAQLDQLDNEEMNESITTMFLINLLYIILQHVMAFAKMPSSGNVKC